MFFLAIVFNAADQQIIPRFIDYREIFKARDRQSKAYSGSVFVAAKHCSRTHLVISDCDARIRVLVSSDRFLANRSR